MNGMVFVFSASASILLALALYGWIFTQGAPARLFASLLTLCAFVAAFYALEIGTTYLPGKILWARMEFAPIALSSLLWFLFSVRRMERPFRLTWVFVTLVSIIPAITCFLAVTGIHAELIRFNYRVLDESTVPVLVAQNGPWFWIHLSYTYGLGVATFLAMLSSLRGGHVEHRPQTIILMFSILLPGLADFLFEVGVRPIPGFSFYAVAISVSSALAAVALYSTRFFALLPVARSLIFNSLADALLVLDADSRICDYNPAGKRLFGALVPTVTDVHKLPSPWGVALGELVDQNGQHVLLDVGLPSGSSAYDVSITPIKDEAGRLRGRCVVVRDVTDRVEANRKLHDSEAKLRRFFEQATEAFALTDEQGRIVEFNPAAELLTGKLRTEVLGVFTWDLQSTLAPARRSVDEARSIAQSMLQKALQGETDSAVFRQFEGKIPATDGNERYFEQTFFPIQTNSGYCLGSTAQDITARKMGLAARQRSEDLAREAQKMLQLVLDLIPQTIFWKDKHSAYLGCNRVFTEWAGLPSLQSVVGLSDKDMPWDALSDQMRDVDLQVISSETPKSNYLQIMSTKHGENRQIRLSKLPLRSDQGEILGVIGIAEDITDWVDNERERILLGTAMEKAVESVVITDSSGIIQYVNPAFLKIYGYAREEVIGKNPRILKSGHHAEKYYRNLWETLASGRVWRGRFVNLRKDGSSTIEEAIISPVLDPNGTATHFVKIARDVTYEVDLEGRFQQAQKMEAIGRLAGGVAHDFNNILTVISGYSEIIGLGLGEDASWKEEIGAIGTAAARAAALTGQLLAFSRKQSLEPAVIDLNSILTGIEQMLQRLIGEDIQLSTQLEPSLGPVFVDKGQVEQVIMNLVVNARDAMPKGGNLSIYTRKIIPDKAQLESRKNIRAVEYAVMEVSDTGTGMSEEVKAHLFEPFFTTKPEHQGTGLGLATVYGIVAQSGGFVEVDSRIGEGTRFQIFFPFASGAPNEKTPSEIEEESVKGSERILFVEDDPAIRKLLLRSLHSSGYEVAEASNASHALDIFHKRPGFFQLLISDVVMPGSSGPALAEILCKEQPSLKVLFISGYTGNEIVEHGGMGNQMNLLQKPFSIRELERRVRKTLDG